MNFAHRARWFALLALPFLCGCSALLGALRPDLNDADSTAAAQAQQAPTVGGRWSERGFLDQDSTVGHSERSPASQSPSYNAAYTGDSWVDRDRADANRRDQARDAESGEQNADTQTPNLPPATKRMYKNGSRATRADFVDESQNEGSLWGSDGQTNYYFTKNKVRGVGDIITITIEDGMIKDVGTEVKRTLTENEKQAEMVLAQNRANARAAGGDKTKDSVASSQAAPAAPDAGGILGSGGSAEVTPADVDISKSLELKTGDTMMAEILERYPNGNYKISGSKRVNYKNGGPRLVNLVGVVRGSDIGDDDTVASGKLYEYRLEAVR